uniref:Uncharacterized protein n=1 Tax=Cyanoderma ruficeps TaxID=181631 RepID=A0A8C3R9P2_9PASS
PLLYMEISSELSRITCFSTKSSASFSYPYIHCCICCHTLYNAEIWLIYLSVFKYMKQCVLFVGQLCSGSLLRLFTGPACGKPQDSGEVGGMEGDSRAMGTAISMAMGMTVVTALGTTVVTAMGMARGTAMGMAISTAMGTAICTAISMAISTAISTAMGTAICTAISMAISTAMGTAIRTAISMAIGSLLTNSAAWIPGTASAS